MIDKDSLPLDKPRRTPDHPTKSHVVKTRVDGKEKVIRFGEQGASTAGKPKEGESERMKAKRASFKSRHAKNIAKGKSSPAYWANKVKWATGGSVGLEDLDEKYEGIKKPDFKMLDSFKDLVRTLQSRAEDAGDQEFDAVRALGRTGAAGSLEDLYAAYSDKPKGSHARRAEAGAADPDRAKTAKMVFDSFKSAGFSDAQAKALTAEINREGSLNPAYLYGTHTDTANRATNVGMLSWQGDRANRLMSFMADRGLIDPSGGIAPGQDALNAQAEYLRWEMENDPSYAKTRETFLGNPNIDQETAHDVLGKNFIRWRIDDPKYRDSGFNRIYEGYDLLNMAQGFAEGGEVNTDDEYAGGGFIQEERTDLPRIYSREPTVAESVEDWWADKIRRVSGDTPFPLDERDSQRLGKRVANLLSYVPISAGMMSGAQAERDIEAGDYGSAALNAGTALLDVVPLAAATKGGASAIKAAADDVTELAAKYMSPDDIARFVADEAGSLPGMGIGQPGRFGENWDDVYHWSRSPEGFSEFDPNKSTSAMSQLGPHVGTPQAAEARYMGWSDSEKTPPAMGFTLPMKADLRKPFVNPSTGKPWTEMDLEMFISDVADENGVDRKLVAPLMRERLAKEGYTSIPYMNDVEDAGSVSHIMLTERPAGSDAVLRSRFAKFDPAMRNAKNLSAGVAAGAIGASQYDPDAIETTAARVRENKFASGGIVRYDPAAVDSIINKLREVNRG